MRPAPRGPKHPAPRAGRRRPRGPLPRGPAPQHSAWSPAGTTGAGAAAAGAAPGQQRPRHGADGCRPLDRAAARSRRTTTAVRAGAGGSGGGPGMGEGSAATPGSWPLSAAEQSGGRGQGGRGRHLAGANRGCRANGEPPAQLRGPPAGLGRIHSPLKGPAAPALEARREGPQRPRSGAAGRAL